MYLVLVRREQAVQARVGGGRTPTTLAGEPETNREREAVTNQSAIFPVARHIVCYGPRDQHCGIVENLGEEDGKGRECDRPGRRCTPWL